MASTPEQLSEIYTQIREIFSSHDIITITPVKGDPPDQYEITYAIPGLSRTNGEVIETSSHTIELSIPFGFPHFPPSCKPKSEIFHPDFDPAAVCLGDFWEHNRSMAELIVLIGRMISGEFFSKDNAFNEEAALWYNENSERLPFSTALADFAVDEIKTEETDEQIEIDTLDDSDLFTDYDYLSVDRVEEEEDQEISLDSTFPEIEVKEGPDLDQLNFLQRKKKFFQIASTINNFQLTSPDTDQILTVAKKAIAVATEEHKNAKEDENQGNPKGALKGYKQTATLVSDYPEISADISRATRSMELLGKDKATSPSEPVAREDSVEIDEATQPPVPKNNQKENAEPKPSQEKKKARGKVQRGTFSKAFLYIPLAIIVLLVGGGGTFYYITTNKLSSAQKSYNQCLSLLEGRSFTGAKRSCDVALSQLAGVRFIKKQEATTLVSAIQQTLNREVFQQGLKGKILVDGQYVNKQDAVSLQNYNLLYQKGLELYSQSEWEAASETLLEALIAAKKIPTNDEKSQLEITIKMQQAKLHLLIQLATKLHKQKDWQASITTHTKALTYLQKLPDSTQAEYRPQLLHLLNSSKFELLKLEADQLFDESKWAKAGTAYQKALLLGKSEEISSPEILAKMVDNHQRSELYHAIKSGNLAFSTGSWDAAILAYDKAQSILSDDKSVFNPSGSVSNSRKLAKIILQASIIKDRQKAQKYKNEKDLVTAKSRYKELLRRIETSSFANDAGFQKMREELSETIDSLELEIFLEEKTQYLLDNYKSLFVTNYSSAIPDNLTKPVVTFVKVISQKYLFKLQCTESGRGRPLTLVMNYAFDQSNNTWGFYSENQ